MGGCISTGVICLALAIVALPANAACPQALSIYGDTSDTAEITFAGALDEADQMQHRFSLRFAENGVVMDGIVMMAGEPDRPWGMILHDCPEGDATGAEIDACTVWQGPIYVIDGKGEAHWLPIPNGTGSTDMQAGETLLLPDLGAALMQSATWKANQITALPGDTFRFKACHE